jgi:hypothetical protein
MQTRPQRGAWRYGVALATTLALSASLGPSGGGASAATRAVNITAFCTAETYVARYDANGATVFGSDGLPLHWANVAAEKLELTTLDEMQASAATSAPSAQLASYSRELSTQFVPWLSDQALLKFWVHPTKTFKNTKLYAAAVAEQVDARYIMESRAFTDPVEHYCPTLRPPPGGTTSVAPHLNNFPAYDTTPAAVEVSGFLRSVAEGDELNTTLTAFANPSLSHLRAVLAKDNSDQIHASFVGSPKSFGGPRDKFGHYFWDIHYRVGLQGQSFSVHLHLYRPNDASSATLAIKLSGDPFKIISFTKDP